MSNESIPFMINEELGSKVCTVCGAKISWSDWDIHQKWHDKLNDLLKELK